MTYIGEIGRWITENESLLSGMVVLVGVILSPLGRGFGCLFARRQAVCSFGAGGVLDHNGQVAGLCR